MYNLQKYCKKETMKNIKHLMVAISLILIFKVLNSILNGNVPYAYWISACIVLFLAYLAHRYLKNNN